MATSACDCGSSSFLHLSDCLSVIGKPQIVYDSICSDLQNAMKVAYGVDRYGSFWPILNNIKRNFKDSYLISSETSSGGTLYLKNGGYLIIFRRDQSKELRNMAFDTGYVEQCDDLASLINSINLVGGGRIGVVEPDSRLVYYE